MTPKRTLLRTVPATLLITTAMSWNLPASAQSGSMPTKPPAASPLGQFGGTAPSEAPTAGQPGSGALPPGLTPAMPASAASAMAHEPRPGTPRVSSEVPGATGNMPARKP